MDLNKYINRHIKTENKLKVSIKDTQKIAAASLLAALEVVDDYESNSITKTQLQLERIFTKMYNNINDSIIDFGEDITMDNIEWESDALNTNPIEYDKIYLMLFGGVLISKHTLADWLKKASFKDTQKIMGIIKDSIISDVNKKQVRNKVLKYYKTPMRNVDVLMDAIAFSSLSLVRDMTLKESGIELMQWISVLDKATTKGCIERNELLYTVDKHEPYKHLVHWEMPGVYHWRCRSFVIPYKGK